MYVCEVVNECIESVHSETDMYDAMIGVHVWVGVGVSVTQV